MGPVGSSRSPAAAAAAGAERRQRGRAAGARAAAEAQGPASSWPRAAGGGEPPTAVEVGTAGTAGAGAGAKARFPGLRGDDIRHPLDKQNTQFLSLIPGGASLAQSLMGPMSEQVMLLENISSSVLVGPQQLPALHASLVEAARILDIEEPELYIRQNPVPNAYTLAIAGRRPFVVIHTSLLELLAPEEVQGVIAHELGHLKCNHGVWLTFANLLALGAGSLLPGISSAIEDNFLRWLRSAEFTCDRAALMVTQDPKVVCSVLMKLAGGSPSIAGDLNVDAFLEQARSYDEATASPVGWYLRNAQNRQLSHPLPVMRAREIDRWANSPEYKKLLRKGIKPAAPEDEYHM